jgi:hypothetical protein
MWSSKMFNSSFEFDDDDQSFAELLSIADQLLDLPSSRRLPLLRNQAKNLGLSLRDRELENLLKQVRREREGRGAKRRGRRQLKIIDIPWILDGLLIKEAFNLLVAMPKVGKTSLLLAMIAAWYGGDSRFLSKDLFGECPPVLIVGNDQPESDWCRMISVAGLPPDIGDLNVSPIVELWDAGNRLLLDEDGIEEIRQLAENHHGLLILIDSIAATVTALGIPEESPEIAEPIRALMEAVSPYGATVVAIHHSSKGRASEGAAAASRGSTALPALASQILKLGPLNNRPESNDARLLLTAEGRGGASQRLILSRTSDGGWQVMGDAVDVLHQEYLIEREHSLTDRDKDALAVVRDRTNQELSTSTEDLVKLLRLDEQSPKDASRIALRMLNKLVTEGLAVDKKVSTGRASRREFWAVQQDLLG